MNYEPDKGDIIWLDLNPQVGHEQAGRRPVLVLSPKYYNQKVGLAIICPITSKVKEYPFIVKIPDNLNISGIVLSDQIKSLDWERRKAEYICKFPAKQLKEVKEKILALLQ